MLLLILTSTNTKHCPVAALSSFLAIRPRVKGPIFINKDHSPIYRRSFSKMLKMCLQLLGHKTNNYSTHFLRIGRATQLAQDKAHILTIKNTGRWISSAFYKYIKPTHFTLPQ